MTGLPGRGDPTAVAVGDQARLKKPHPCGGYDWEVTRIGADIGLRCRKCGRRILLPRDEFERRVRQITTVGNFGEVASATGDAEDA